MMKRTTEAKFAKSDQARNINRQILAPQKDTAEIYYKHEAVEEAQASAPTESSDAGIQPREDSAAKIQQPLPVSRAPVIAAQEIDDEDVPVSAILLSILAPKLKKDPESIPMTGTISHLVGGRSTLSNEIVGDLLAEFTNAVPDKPEEVPLGALCQILSVNHLGELGKVTTSLVSKMLSSKFPGDYGQSKVRQHLQEKWGLGQKRQDAVLLLAVTKQPGSRLASSNDASMFLDENTATYFAKEKLALPSLGSVQSNEPVVDAQALRLVKEQNDFLLRDIMNVLSGHVGGSTNTSDDVRAPGRESEDTTTKQLDMWLAEHGDDYAKGMKPIFDAKKQRVYDSFWNWNAHDIFALFQLHKSTRACSIKALEKLSMSIVNRACDRTVEQLDFVISEAGKNPSTEPESLEAMRLLRQVSFECLDRQPRFVNLTPRLAPLTTIGRDGSLVFNEIARNAGSTKKEATKDFPSVHQDDFHLFPVSCVDGTAINYSHNHSEVLAYDLEHGRYSGFSFSGRNVLVTGAGRHSIGNHILRYLLAGGARVTVTTSSFSEEVTTMFQSIYTRHGSKGSVLRLVPFNQGSLGDVQNLINHIYTDPAWDLDFIVPFAAISENGRGVEDLDSKSEIAHRAMLTNLVRLLGAVASHKRLRDIVTRPATVVLPLSPNHGLMGNDGLYSESKRSLEALLPKWASESWGSYLSLMGVIIGWTRGTSLMDDNDVVAQAVESFGVRTFSAAEMASNIVSLIGGRLNAACQESPLVVDMGGGLGKVQSFKDRLTKARRELHAYADLQKLTTQEIRRDITCVTGNEVSTHASTGKRVRARANIQLPLPQPLDYEKDIAPLATSLDGMVDLSRVVVVTGFAELGPHGNSRTRWEMEDSGTFSLEGCVEMAWLMNLIKHHTGVDKAGNYFSGWVDTKTSEPINDDEIPAKYLEFIATHSGIRKIEPENCDNGYDPHNKESLIEVALQRDLAPFETSLEIAETLGRQHGNKVTITKDGTGGCQVQLRAGATILVPRSSRFNRTVAGQIPAGWTAKRYGISDDIIEQVDPVTLFSLVCTVEALMCSGIVDPYEFYQHIHVSEFGNCLGSSMGGLSSLRKMHRDRYIDKSVKSDILQETFINTTGAWINMLLSSSAGPIRTPVGACATSLESLDTGCDLIMLKKAKVCLVGGVEDFVEDVSFEFGSMKATCDTDAEFAAGRAPKEMSRPTASSRSGFVESQGCGVQVLTSAELALEMGLPIFGIVAYANMAADKAGRSVPAPGKGVLTNAREKSTTPSPLLDINYRRRLLQLRRTQIHQGVSDYLDILKTELAFLQETTSAGDLDTYRENREKLIKEEARRQDAEATFNLGNQFWTREETGRISPIRGSLSVWGLSIDDISVASLHGTSTVQNDLNEPMVIQEQMRHLGRRRGNLLPCVCQKWLTGHSKGAAGSWMINGCLQMMNSGMIPGNRNADNVEEKLRKHHHLVFPNTTLQTECVKACSVTSFGFGQKGAQALIVNPRYLLATVGREKYNDYISKRDQRWRKACRRLSEAMVRDDMVSACIKTQAPYAADDGVAALLDPTARF
ncbi:fatty acid synthase subunit alpha reductase [Fusarium sporotrichioides]|uniref:beta-ketoacyl-[acyl-carrier-protein] synthase I n=1 Tax=Fusarium sporotrichioides TaxID=5514 RepID=A0A395S8L1_FUSSP|nr:fatty acid synthase subunit alpha reductase [Fusarium sporotrichioides]